MEATTQQLFEYTEECLIPFLTAYYKDQFTNIEIKEINNLGINLSLYEISTNKTFDKFYAINDLKAFYHDHQLNIKYNK